jgi:hypothetical protein
LPKCINAANTAYFNLIQRTRLNVYAEWRANCDVSIMIFNSDPVFSDLSEIAEVTYYVVSYACKGNPLSLQK